MKRVITHIERTPTIVFTETNPLEYFYGAETENGTKFVIVSIDDLPGIKGFFLMDNDMEIMSSYSNRRYFKALLEQLIDKDEYSVYQFVDRNELMEWFLKEE